MLHTPTSSPRSSRNCSEAATGSAEIDPNRARSQTPREHQFQQRQRNSQKTRPAYKNIPPELASFYPSHIQDQPRWDPSGSGSRYVGPRRGPADKDVIDFQALPILKQPHKKFNTAVVGIPTETKISEEKYRAQLRAFPELPQLAHERIREFGNEIVACYPVQLCKFFNDSLIETSPNSFAVFTKKTRTGQRWLMVFKCERARVNVCFNKLLTNQLLVRCLNPVSVEVEPARGGGLTTSPNETCVFTFGSHPEANKFVQDIHESQTIVWNHREMFLEQTLRGPSTEYYMDPANIGYYSPARPLSARASSTYFIPELPPPLTPRMKSLPPVVSSGRTKRSPFTVSSRSTTPRADLDENWRIDGLSAAHATAMADLNTSIQPTLTSVTQSPIRKRSKGSTKDTYANASNPVTTGTGGGGGGEGDFVYNSLTHAMALQQNPSPKGATTTLSNSPEGETPMKEVSTVRKFQISDVLVSNKRDVGTGAPDEEFFSIGAGELHMIDNGEEQLDEIKCFSSAGQLMFSQILFGWNKVRFPEGSRKNSNDRCWWIGAATLGTVGLKLNNNSGGGGDAPRIREFKATFTDEETAKKFAELFQDGAVKGNNPDVRKRYVAQSLRI